MSKRVAPMTLERLEQSKLGDIGPAILVVWFFWKTRGFFGFLGAAFFRFLWFCVLYKSVEKSSFFTLFHGKTQPRGI